MRREGLGPAEMIAFAEGHLPGQEIPEEFLSTLRRYATESANASAEVLATERPYIPKVVEKALSSTGVCGDADAADALADCLLSLMCPTGGEAGKPALWAADQLSRKAKQLSNKQLAGFKCTKARYRAAISDYPAEYAALLSDDDLCALSSQGSSVYDALTDEIAKRGLPFPDCVFEHSTLSLVAPRTLFALFGDFTTAPTLNIAVKFLEVFERRPPLHLVCVNECVNRGRYIAESALAMIGRLMGQRLPLRYPLSMFFHPSVAPLADEIESAWLRPNDDSLKDAFTMIPDGYARFALPLLLEFPDWLGVLAESDEHKYKCVISGFP